MERVCFGPICQTFGQPDSGYWTKMPFACSLGWCQQRSQEETAIWCYKNLELCIPQGRYMLVKFCRLEIGLAMVTAAVQPYGVNGLSKLAGPVFG